MTKQIVRAYKLMKHHPQLPHIHCYTHPQFMHVPGLCLCVCVLCVYTHRDLTTHNCGIGSFSYQQTTWRECMYAELADERMVCHHFYSSIYRNCCTATRACNCLIIIVIILGLYVSARVGETGRERKSLCIHIFSSCFYFVIIVNPTNTTIFHTMPSQHFIPVHT